MSSPVSLLARASRLIDEFEKRKSIAEVEEDLGTILSDLKAAFLAVRGDAIRHARAKKLDVKAVEKDWRETRHALDADQLMHWVFNARDNLHHPEKGGGSFRVLSSMKTSGRFSTVDLLPTGPDQSVVIQGDGTWLRSKVGSPYETHERIDDHPALGAMSFRVVVTSPPREHLGMEFPEGEDAAALLRAAHAYLVALLPPE